MGSQEVGTAEAPGTEAAAAGRFARVVCGVDGRRLGFEAARQAGRLASPAGLLTLVSVVEIFDALSGSWGDEPPRRRLHTSDDRTLEDLVSDLGERAHASLAWGEAQVTGPARLLSRVVEGEVHQGLLTVARDEDADLVAVGAHGGSRFASATLAETTAMVLHDAQCSVLVARHGFDPGHFPTRIVVGVDGSSESRAALAVAASLRERAGGALTVVTAGRDQQEAVAALDGFDAPHDHVATPDRPVDALVTAARTADLAIVGSRGLHGASALGSVSERLAFRALSSVLVVRPE